MRTPTNAAAAVPRPGPIPDQNRVFIAAVSTLFILLLLSAGTARADALARLQSEKLKAVHQAIHDLRADWRSLPRSGPYQDYRANLHVHSLLSHDSRGTVAEIVAAARKVGTRVLMFTEHPSPHYDYVTDGHQGMKEGVLLIPGAESEGFLVYPTRSLRGLETKTPQEFADLVRGRGNGLIFLCHLEERMDWDIRGLTGIEIYNTHADVKDEKRLLAAMRNPLWMINSASLFRQYPQEAFSALQDYPADYLRRWDQLCEKAPHTGVGANDAHQNIGLTVRLTSGNKALFEDALGKKLYELDAGAMPVLAPLVKDKKPGDVLFQMRLDPYECSLRHVGTHLLLTELSQRDVRDALTAGRAFVAFDWLADATGFDFAAQSPSKRYEMGSRLAFEKNLRVHAQAPLPVRWKLVRNGKVLSEATGRTFTAPMAGPGNYRSEAWLKIAGDDMIWVLSNPIYVRPA